MSCVITLGLKFSQPFEKVLSVKRECLNACNSDQRRITYTVELPNKGHFNLGAGLLAFIQTVLWWEVQIAIVSTIIGAIQL